MQRPIIMYSINDYDVVQCSFIRASVLQYYHNVYNAIFVEMPFPQMIVHNTVFPKAAVFKTECLRYWDWHTEGLRDWDALSLSVSVVSGWETEILREWDIEMPSVSQYLNLSVYISQTKTEILSDWDWETLSLPISQFLSLSDWEILRDWVYYSFCLWRWDTETGPPRGGANAQGPSDYYSISKGPDQFFQ